MHSGCKSVIAKSLNSKLWGYTWQQQRVKEVFGLLTRFPDHWVTELQNTPRSVASRQPPFLKPLIIQFKSPTTGDFLPWLCVNLINNMPSSSSSRDADWPWNNGKCCGAHCLRTKLLSCVKHRDFLKTWDGFANCKKKKKGKKQLFISKHLINWWNHVKKQECVRKSTAFSVVLWLKCVSLKSDRTISISSCLCIWNIVVQML